ncbi:MAG: NAD-dependent epimerase/dehydratase family protein [Akkermansiaceae bacterium]|nr:NAD-dependent epimerase/dehydratase family protein [Akkermansiaceae bacterium]
MTQVAITGATGRLATAMMPVLFDTPIHWTSVSRQAGDGLVSYDDFLKRDQESLDAIVHMAWSSVPVSAEADPSLAWNQDFPLIERLLGARLIRPGGKFVFISSAGTVYGDTHGEIITENHPLRPVGQYGAAKVYAESLVAHYANIHGVHPAVLRVTNPYGFASRSGTPQGVIGFALAAALSGKTFEIWGDGLLPKDYLFIDDLASAILRAVCDPLEGIFNIAGGTSITLLQILDLVSTVTGQTLNTKHLPGNPWDAGQGTIIWDKFKTSCGWTPKVDLVTGLSHQWQAMKGETKQK